MKNRISIAMPLPCELMELSTRLKHDDVEELKAATGRTAEDVMTDIAANGYNAMGAYIDGRLEVVFGVNSVGYPEGMASVWMLSSDTLYQHAKTLMQMTRPWLDDQQAKHGMLFNFVDARATRSLNWLKRVGFDFTPIDSHGVFGLPFVLITRG
jgi:hypothetical protein